MKTLMKTDWITENIPWIFSGVGVSCLGGLGSFLKRKSRGRNDKASNVAPTTVRPIDFKSHAPIAQRKASHPTPWEIRRRLQRVPLFQRSRISEDYVGLEVCWPARLAELRQLQFSKCEVVLRFGDKNRWAKIRFVVNIDRCQRFKILLQNEWVLVAGKICRIDDDIVLEDVAVGFE